MSMLTGVSKEYTYASCIDPTEEAGVTKQAVKRKLEHFVFEDQSPILFPNTVDIGRRLTFATITDLLPCCVQRACESKRRTKRATKTKSTSPPWRRRGS